MRTKAIAEAAASKKHAEYDWLIADRVHERRQHEAEEQRFLEQRRAQHDRDIAMLAAERLAAIADTKLNAIEMAMEEGEGFCSTSRRDTPIDLERTDMTEEWIIAQEVARHPTTKSNIFPQQPYQRVRILS